MSHEIKFFSDTKLSSPFWEKIKFDKTEKEFNEEIVLPKNETAGGMPIWECLQRRRSIRNYKNKAVSIKDLSQILWASSGIVTKKYGIELRTSPSAGALYPIEIYVFIFNVNGVKKGIYHLNVYEWKLKGIKEGDFSSEIAKASIYQTFIEDAAFTIFLTSVTKRTTRRYRERGVRYILMDLGCIIQNIYLAVTSLNLGGCVIGAFYDDQVNKILEVNDREETTLALFSIGAI
ncbi:MAG: SagB/ThcOx family dehydrogenase [Acidobacteriota bacterium]